MKTQYKAMIVDEDSKEKCSEILGVDCVPTLTLENNYWLVYDSTMSNGYTALLPHTIFKDRFTSVENRGDYHIVERL